MAIIALQTEANHLTCLVAMYKLIDTRIDIFGVQSYFYKHLRSHKMKGVTFIMGLISTYHIRIYNDYILDIIILFLHIIP